MDRLSVEREDANKAFRPLFKLSDSELDEISQSVFIEEVNNGELVLKATDGLAHLISRVDCDVSNASEFEELSVDLDTVEQIIKKTSQDITIKKFEESLMMSVFDGNLYLKSYLFDNDIYDPYFDDSSASEIQQFDIGELELVISSAKTLSSNSLSPEYSFIFMDESEAWVCNGYSVTRVDGSFMDYSLPMECCDFIKSLIKHSDDESLDVEFSDETVKISNEVTELYHERANTELSQDYKDVISDESGDFFQVSKPRLKKILSILTSVPFGDGSINLIFSSETLECELKNDNGETSSFILSSNVINAPSTQKTVESTLSHLKSVVSVQDQEELTFGLDEYCISVSGDQTESVIFVQ